jgi:hypothetical protein
MIAGRGRAARGGGRPGVPSGRKRQVTGGAG